MKLVLAKLVVLQEKTEQSKLASYRAAFQAAWRSDEVRALELRLSSYREELDSHILVAMNAKLDKHDARIVEVLAISNSLQTKLGKIEDAAASRHAETVAAILTSQDGISRTIARRPTTDFVNQPDFVSSNVSQIQVLYGNEAVKDDRPSPGAQPSGAMQNHGSFSDVARRILDALHFRTIDERFEIIPDAYSRTFAWIWGDHPGDLGRWSSFSHWLEMGSGCYWISGKAGSGKSTLMKYIHADSRTESFLKQWSGDNQLLTASFFFWKAGTSLQKSQSGLVRSLLFQILEQRIDMVPVLFPGLYRTLATNYVPTLDISFYELEKALRILLSNTPQETRICLFIDGLDEYDGDHNEVSELFTSTTASDAVKFVVSSRPIPACVAAFWGCPCLRLQDLTAGDIAEYAEGKLSNHKLMQRMEAIPSGLGTTAELVESITSRASGVFLWVMLVVKSLLNGLQNSDTRADLLRRLDGLPTDLENLYKHMLGSMSIEYQRKASIMIQLVMRSRQIQRDAQMTVLQLSYAEEEEPLQSIKARIEPISPLVEAARCESTEGRMRSRCCGLLESQELSITEHDSVLCVGFLHRTVLDFLEDPIIWQGLLDLTQDANVNLDELLLGSCLDEMKRKPILERHVRYSRAAFNMFNAMAYCYVLETRSGLPKVAYLDEVYNVMQQYSRFRNESGEDVWAELVNKPVGLISDQNLETPHSFLFLVALSGLSTYLMHKIQDPSANWAQEQDQGLLLFHLVCNFFQLSGLLSDYHDSRSVKLLRSIKALLDHNLNPNTQILLTEPQAKLRLYMETAQFSVECGSQGELSPWNCVILALSEIPVRESRFRTCFIIYCELLEIMIRAGGDLSLRIGSRSSKKRLARRIIQEFLTEGADVEGGPEMAAKILSLLDDASAPRHDKLKEQAKADSVDSRNTHKKRLSRLFTKLKV